MYRKNSTHSVDPNSVLVTKKEQNNKYKCTSVITWIEIIEIGLTWNAIAKKQIFFKHSKPEKNTFCDIYYFLFLDLTKFLLQLIGKHKLHDSISKSFLTSSILA